MSTQLTEAIAKRSVTMCLISKSSRISSGIFLGENQRDCQSWM
jgi:hypothetical protein